MAQPFTQLVWSDEFNYNGQVDTSKWHHQTILPNGSGWFNGEIQHYTDRIENSRVVQGFLKVTARKETFVDQGVSKDYTSARLNSKFAFTYGRVEVRAKLPAGAGTWPAIWLLGKNINELGAYWQTKGYGTTPWPACGEIDIMEHWGSNPNFVQSAVHTPSTQATSTPVGGILQPGVTANYHNYILDWSEEKLSFYMDSIHLLTYNPPVKDASTWPFDQEQFILLNFAILPSIDQNFNVGSMDIDYVRVYQKATVSSLEDHKEFDFDLYPNPTRNKVSLRFDSPLGSTSKAMIVDLLGKVRMEFDIPEGIKNHSLSGLYGLESGIYLVKVSGNGTEIAKKLLID